LGEHVPVRTHLRIVSLLAALASAVVAATMITRDDPEPTVPFHRMVASAVSTDHLVAAGHLRVFFAHQSVGMNLLEAIPEVYADRGLPVPTVAPLSGPDGRAETVAQTGSVPVDGPDGFLAHAYFGQNGDPMAKIADFDARVRGGLGREVDVALMKLCYADIVSTTDVDAVFASYRDTMADLERDFPEVTFLHVTTPVSTDPGWRSRVKKLLGRDAHLGPADNAARERLNTLMRGEYPADRLFDLAALESTAPDGRRSAGSDGGSRYYALYPGYAADAGHLNEAGAMVAAAHLLDLMASATRADHP
jgi:hypothetical protein